MKVLYLSKMDFYYPLMAVGIKRKYKNAPAIARVEKTAVN